MKHLNSWFSANKISPNIEKTELVIFKSPRKVKIKLSGKRLYLSNSIKHLGVRIDRFLHNQVNSISIAVKLNRANALLLKITNYVLCIDSHLNYSRIVWAQNIKTVRRLIILQKKALQKKEFRRPIISFKPTFLNILKFGDKIALKIFFSSVNPSTGKSLLYFIIGLHFPETYIGAPCR